jgi:hypothetical protein
MLAIEAGENSDFDMASALAEGDYASRMAKLEEEQLALECMIAVEESQTE